MKPAPWLRELLAQLGSASSRNGRLWQCPAHVDSNPSLALDEIEDGRALLHCHAGCSTRDVLKVLRLSLHDLTTAPSYSPARHIVLNSPRVNFPPLTSRTGHPAAWGFRHEAFHPYGDRWRLERLRHPTTGGKDLQWQTCDEHGAWIPGLRGTTLAELPLYREHEVLMALAADDTLVLVESESSADAIRAVGIYATTWAGGAGSIKRERLRDVLHDGQGVVIAPDNDEAGLACLAQLQLLLPHASVLMPPPGQDARDLLNALGSRAFADAIKQAGRLNVAGTAS